KVFLMNSRKYFCVNYFIDTDHLAIPDENIFTATEIRFLKPMVNQELLHEFIASNEWIRNYFPAPYRQPAGTVPAPDNGWRKRMAERILGGYLGEWLDKKAFRMTLSRWKRKFSGFDQHEF